jgi:hypothetical protein
MRKRLFWLLAIVLTVSFTGLESHGGCTEYPDTRVEWLGDAAFCAGVGPGCTECFEGGKHGPFNQT